MVTLTQTPLNFNRKMILSNNGGDLSSDSGLLLFREFDATLRFSDTINQSLRLKDNRLYHTHSNEKLFRQKLYQIVAGYFQDDAADDLTNDPVFTESLGTQALASQPSLSRFYDFPKAIWRSIYSTNLIKSFNKQIKRYSKRKEQFNEASLDRFLVSHFEDYNQQFSTRCHIGFDQARAEIIEMFNQ